MDSILIIVGLVCLGVGLIGSVFPLPGPPLSFVGLLAIFYSKYATLSTNSLAIIGIVTIIITVLDYYVPIWGTKKFGGSKGGTYGASVGLFVGMFLGPIGIFLGAFIGAFIGEYLSQKNHNIAFRAAIGSFLGIIAGMVAKIALCLFMIYFAVSNLDFSHFKF